MKSLSLRCPNCGNAAVELNGQKEYKPNVTHAAFTCGNPNCRCAFHGEILLTLASIPGMETFSSNAGGATRTDC
jgi:hypothetical protein